MIHLPFLGWAAVGAGAVILVLSGALWIQGERLDAAQSARDSARRELASFQVETRRLGAAADRAAREQEARDKRAKERADAENKDLRRELDARRRQLRDRANSAAGSLVPGAKAGAASPGTAAFDRALLDRALRDFEAGVEGLVGEGAEAVIDLDSAKRWAQ